MARYRLSIALGFSLAAASGVVAQEPPKLPAPAPATIPAPSPAESNPDNVVTRYTLVEALASGLSRHPQLAAMKASMNAALKKGQGLDEVKRTIGFLQPDISYREKQSDLGLRAAMAEYDQGVHEITFAVIRCYYTVVYAREQTRVARDLVDQLHENLRTIIKIVESKGGTKDITQNTVDNLKGVIGQAESRLTDAETGVERARAALREAMGLEPGARVDAADEMLPQINAKINRDTVIAHAVNRRGEVQLAQIGADVTRLEACAQWAKKFTLLGTTYANAADIHARSIPAAQYDHDYRPGAIGPEMPDRVVGNYKTRTEIVKIYADRAKSAADQARSLVGLEAENAYYTWLAASQKVESWRKAAKAGRDLKARLREAAGGVQTKEQVLLTEVQATLAEAALNEAIWNEIVALANLERITAGGVRVNFAGR